MPTLTIPDHSADEAALIRDIEEELEPASALGGVLARRVGLHSVRLERSARQDRAAVEERVRHAADRFDEARIAEVDRLMASLAADPASNVRALRSSPEGVDRMIKAWRAIRADLHIAAEERWTYGHHQRAENLMGRRPEELPYTRLQALSQSVWNDPKHLEPAERQARDPKEIRAFAKQELDRLIADQIGELEAHRKTLDLDRIALDRAGAADLALHDPSPAALLARKQEAADERALFRALKEFRLVEADFLANHPEPAPQPTQPAPSPAPKPELASIRQPQPPAPAPASTIHYSPVVRHGEGPMAIGGGQR